MTWKAAATLLVANSARCVFAAMAMGETAAFGRRRRRRRRLSSAAFDQLKNVLRRKQPSKWLFLLQTRCSFPHWPWPWPRSFQMASAAVEESKSPSSPLLTTAASPPPGIWHWRREVRPPAAAAVGAARALLALRPRSLLAVAAVVSMSVLVYTSGLLARDGLADSRSPRPLLGFEDALRRSSSFAGVGRGSCLRCCAIHAIPPSLHIQNQSNWKERFPLECLDGFQRPVRRIPTFSPLKWDLVFTSVSQSVSQSSSPFLHVWEEEKSKRSSGVREPRRFLILTLRRAPLPLFFKFFLSPPFLSLRGTWIKMKQFGNSTILPRSILLKSSRRIISRPLMKEITAALWLRLGCDPECGWWDKLNYTYM